MKKNPGRKERRDLQFRQSRKPGDLNRKSTHDLRTKDGRNKNKEE
jgi:hypothetical protein